MKDGIHIIRGKEEHCPEILRLMSLQLREHAIGVDETALSETIRAILKDGSRGIFIVAERGQCIAGVAYLSFMISLEHSGKCAWLEELYVLPEHRGQGIGGLLIDAALEHAAGQDCAALDLEVDHAYAQVERLYERKGFKKLARNRWVMEQIK